jgi:hypothetical protein
MLDVEDMYNHFDDLKFNNIDNIFDTIYNLPEEDLQGLVEFIFKCIHNSHVSGDSLFNFSTNASLSGSAYPCSCIDCKLKNLSELSFFATLYAEKVIIPSPIDYHYQQFTHHKLPINRYRLCTDIVLLLYIKPLVLRRIIEFYTFHMLLCKECLKKEIEKEKKLFEQEKQIKEYITNEMKKDFKISTDTKLKNLFIHVEPKSNLILPDDTFYRIEGNPKCLKKYPKTTNVSLPFETLKELGIVDYILDPIINDFILHNIYNESLKTTYLTNRPIDTLIMKKLGQDNIANKNTLNYIKPVLPLIQNVDLENLLKIRDNDYDSFLVYRDKLREMIKISDLKTEKDYQEAYNDLIQPEINKMNNVLKKNKKHLIRKIGIDVGLTSIICSVGIYNHFSFDGITGLMSLLGISTGIRDIANLSSEEPIEENELYFLWKVNEKNKKSI